MRLNAARVGRFWSGLVGVLVGALLIGGFSAVAGNGDPLILGAANRAGRSTWLASKGPSVLKLNNTGTGPALHLKTSAGVAPMLVESDTVVANLNADSLDGLEATAFAAAAHHHDSTYAAIGHDHDTDYLGIADQATDSDLFDGLDSSAFFHGHVTGAAGLPFLGTTCAHQGGRLIGIARDGAPYCSFGSAGTFADSGQALGGNDSYGVALGDLDGDGDLDAYVANRFQGNRLWVNDGAGTFTDPGQSLGSSNSYGVALGDLDGDGDLDAYVTNYQHANRVWVNDGSGGFTDSGQALGPNNSIDVVLGDLDGDGDLDAFNANNGANRVWVNDGTGTFTDSGQALGSGWSYGAALGDLDGDGDLDTYVANFDGQQNRVWENDGTGTFTDSGQTLGSYSTTQVGLGDLDGDGDLDAYTVNLGQADRVWKNDGTGTFTDSTQTLGGSYAIGVALGDLDGDGDLDAYVTNRDTLASDPGDRANRVWLNDGTGTFTDSGQSLGSYDSRRAALGDLDGDGDLDAYTTNSEQPNRVWHNT